MIKTWNLKSNSNIGTMEKKHQNKKY